MSKVKKQHYLPQFYLRNFANSDGKICAVDANLEAPYIKTKIADVAQGRYYYDFHGDGDKQSIEKMFSVLEGQLAKEFKDILQRAHDRSPLTQENKSAILRFLKLQFLRSDWMRDKIPRDFILENFKPEYVDRADKLIHAYMISEGMFTSILDYISQYEMKVLYCHETLEIYTSSFPLFFNHSGNINELIERLKSFTTDELSIGVNLFFPLTSMHSIYIYDPNKPIGIEEDSWTSEFITSGISWSINRIYFREHKNSLALYPMLKRLLKRQ